MAAAVSEWQVYNKLMADGRYLVVLCILMDYLSTNCIAGFVLEYANFSLWDFADVPHVCYEDFAVR